MLEERSQQVLIRLDAPDRPGDRLPQMQSVVGDEVRQVRVLGVVPDLFVRVELRGVGGQPFDADSPTEAFLKPSSSRSMHGPAIHDQDHRSAEPLQQGGDKGFKIVRDDVVIEDVEVEPQPFAPWRDCNRRNDRQSVMPIPTIQHGSFSTRSPGTPHRRLQHKARFVEADHRPTATSSFFLCEASPLFATVRWRRRHAPVRVAPASGNSSRAVAANAKRPIDRNGRRTSSRSIAQFAAGSTTRSPNHVCAAPAANNSATARTVCRSAWKGRRGRAWRPAPDCLLWRAPTSTARPHLESPPVFGRLRLACTLPSGVRLLASDAPEAVRNFHVCSCSKLFADITTLVKTQ